MLELKLEMLPSSSELQLTFTTGNYTYKQYNLNKLFINSINFFSVKINYLQLGIQSIPVCHQWSRHGTWNRSRTQWSVSWSQCSPTRNMYRKLYEQTTLRPEKKRSNVFFVISPTQLWRFWWKLACSFLNKFAVKWCSLNIFIRLNPIDNSVWEILQDKMYKTHITDLELSTMPLMNGCRNDDMIQLGRLHS